MVRGVRTVAEIAILLATILRLNRKPAETGCKGAGGPVDQPASRGWAALGVRLAPQIRSRATTHRGAFKLPPLQHSSELIYSILTKSQPSLYFQPPSPHRARWSFRSSGFFILWSRPLACVFSFPCRNPYLRATSIAPNIPVSIRAFQIFFMACPVSWSTNRDDRLPHG